MKRSILLFIFLMLFGCAPKIPPQEAVLPETHTPKPANTTTADPKSWNLVWEDEFDQPDGSTPDPAKWN
jgi:hypothetical protein